jgi:hypothetical protein
VIISGPQLARIGEALYGRNWRVPMAKLIGRHVSMIWHYTRPKKPTPFPADAWALIEAEIHSRMAHLESLCADPFTGTIERNRD